MKNKRIYLVCVLAIKMSCFIRLTSAVAEPPPPTGLVLWLDAEDIDADGKLSNNPQDGQRIERWADKSGHGNHVEQASADRRPTLEVAELQGKPIVRFHGKDSLGRAITKGLSAGDQAFHAFFVMQATPVAPHTNPRLLDLHSGSDQKSADRHGFWVGYQSNGRNRLGIVNGDEGEAASVAWNKSPNVLEVVYAGAQNWSQYLNGNLDGSGRFKDRTFSGFHSDIRLSIGQHGGLSLKNTFYKGDLAEVLIYNRELSATEQNSVGTYLEHKYKLDTAYGSVPQFEKDIRPILAAHCFECHGARELEAQLDLRSVTSMLRGGKRGPVIVRGYPDRSELIEMIASGKMPPDDAKKLSDHELALIRRWIGFSAPATEKVIETSPADLISKQDRAHWAYQRPVWHDPPTVRSSDRIRQPIDAFILAKLESKGLTLSLDADRATLVRRVFLDLIGLPPSPKEITEFLTGKRSDAYEHLVNRLLKSPHFGERWGRHWLDNAGYVDVYGGDNDAGIINTLTDKWRYRDYVIQSFNRDKPFDRFITEQLAGDELFDWRSAKKFTPEIIEALTATGFLLAAVDNTHAPELNTPDKRHTVLQLTGEIVASNLLAATLHCAKCHNHKYEAIPQQDYYRFLAVFSPSFNPERWVVSTAHGIPDVSPNEKTVIDRKNDEIKKQIAVLKKRQSELRGPYRQRLFDTKLSKLSAPIRDDVKTAIRTPVKDRNEIQKYLEKKLGPLLKVTEAEVTAALNDQDTALLGELTKQVSTLVSQRRSYGTIQVVYEANRPSPTFLLRRGDHLRPGREVQPGLLTILSEANLEPKVSTKPAGNSSGRRLELARHLTDANSLAGGHVARVIVNRFWQHLFGRAIVETSDNFGVSGSRPTHPELLDRLAIQFIRGGWRAKPLIRMLVTSSVYRQDSRDETAERLAAKADPSNDLLWKMRLRQLESEIVRDTILAVSGKLDRTAGGPPIPLEVRPDGKVVIKETGLLRPTDKWRRSIYVLARRNYQLSMLAIFDQPIVSTNCTRRTPSAVVTQSLTMLNDRFVLQQAEFFAARVDKDSKTEQDKVELAFQISLGRRPKPDEAKWCHELISRHTQRYRRDKVADAEANRRALTHLCHVLLNTSEFLYVH